MPTSLHPLAARCHDEIIVQMQGDHGSTADGCLADDHSAVITPLKMLGPDLRARVEQPDPGICERIDGLGLCSLVAIACSTSQPQIAFV